MFNVDDAVMQQILDTASEKQIISTLRSRNVRSMTQDGLLKVCNGITTVAEVMSAGS